MARTEYFHDPDAPTPNRIVVAVTAFVLDQHGRVLLIRRSDNGLWALPGGAQDVGEYVAETVVRETHEETGITVEVAGIVGIYSDPNHIIAYDDGEVRQQFSICFRARYLSGETTPSSESTHVAWIAAPELDALDIHASMRLRIDHGYANLDEPYIG
ncbi:NUDIX domain-containing protein [Phytohabitans sp. ZYX-F-186]|uniref:NUDIX domain-containing protein n=1 Tax=Phytohabitans maris TaxID=3071409 RepID=A0ABU0ZMW6_9ACTN|nr:NUDIX domain-containing protein [Phytohabitans sp. ZYX-F-186]MDQ7908366.1 NUDIX domain-containing protein [Phytohabitans sp. ZYX-F-186]